MWKHYQEREDGPDKILVWPCSWLGSIFISLLLKGETYSSLKFLDDLLLGIELSKSIGLLPNPFHYRILSYVLAYVLKSEDTLWTELT